MQRIVGANLHALAAADAAREKVLFVQRARRPQQPIVAAFAQPGVRAHQRHHGRTRCKTRNAPCAVRCPAMPLRCSLRKKRNCKAVVRAAADAVHAHQALGLAPRRAADRVVAALAVQQAAIALVAAGWVLVQSKHRPPRDRAQQRAQRANRPAPEARNAQTQRKNDQE